MTKQQRDYDYYIRLKKINIEKAEEYKKEFRPTGVLTHETRTDDINIHETAGMTNYEIEKKNIETMEQLLHKKEQENNQTTTVEEKKPEILYSVKEVKKMLLDKGVKNAKFLKDEQVMQKAKEMGL